MKNKRLKKIVSLMVVFTMVFTTAAPIAQAAEKWSGLASGDVLIKDTITKICDGVNEHEVVTNNKSGNDQKIDFITEIKPSDSIKVVAGYGKNNADSWTLKTTSAQAEAYMKDNPGHTVVSGINADFFNMGTGEPLGALVMEGKVKHESYGRYYFGIQKDGKAIISNNPDLSNLETAVGGDALLINNGEVLSDLSAYGELRYSRTAIGIKEDGTIVTFVTYGNRAPVSMGRTYMDIAEMLKGAGCTYALALDGGGSATLVSRPEGTTGLQLRNHPVDGAEREVSSSLLVVSTKEATGVFSHAQLTPNNEVYTPNSKIQFDANGVDTAGMEMELPSGVTYALAEESKTLGTIDPSTGLFTAGANTGIVTVNMLHKGSVIGSTSVEIVVPDSIYFATEEVSLGFEEESTMGLVVRSKGRDIHYKVGDIKWSIENPAAGTFNGNTFISSEGESITTKAHAVSAYDDSVKGEITVVVGKLPTVVWDFEDIVTDNGATIPAKDYYVNGYKSLDENGIEIDNKGILSTSNYDRGGVQSIEVVNLNEEEPVRFGANSLKLNYDFTQCGEVTEGACVGTSAGMTVPGVPTGIGVWVYAPEGVGIDWEKDEDGNTTQAGFWLRGQVKDGSGATVPYDFTLEPKVITEGSGKLPGIYWEGWKYLEADLTKLSAPFSIKPGMTFRLMYVAGTKMGTKTANSLYFDNLQFVYGTNVDDIDNPIINSITANGKELKNGTVLETNTVNIDSIFSDVQNKYTTGIDKKTVRMYIDGVNVVDNPKYEYALDGNQMNHLYNLKLKDGSHSVTVTVRDGFGNETSETRNFTVDTKDATEVTTVKVVADGDAVLGQNVKLQIKASDATVKENTTVIKLGNLYKEYEVVPSENYDVTTKYSKLAKTITVEASRKDNAVAEDDNVIATLVVKVPANLLPEDVFNYTIKSGKFETLAGTYDTYSSNEIKMPVKASYSVGAAPIVIGGENGVLYVTDLEGNPAANVSVYEVNGDVLVGTIDENGKLVTDRFNVVAGEHSVYAKDDKGMLSFHKKIYTYEPQGDATGIAHNIRFNSVEDSTSQANISWMSNPLVETKQILKYAVKGSGNWTTVEAKKQQIEFQYHGYCATDVNAVLLKDLVPGTTYEYVIGTEDLMSEVKTFTTDSKGRKDSKFFILGDIQDPDKNNLTGIVDTLNDSEWNYGIQIGDAIDQANDYGDWSALGDIVGEKMLGDTEMISVMGNHEYYGDSDGSIAGAIYNNDVTDSGTCYSMKKGNVYIAVINFADNANQIKAATEWLKEDAAKTTAAWKLVVAHQPAYFTNSVGGNDPVYAYLPDACEEAGIDAVFSGHDHSFARTNPLIDDQINEEDGILYYICGAIGSKRYPASTMDKFDYGTIFAKDIEDYTAAYLTVESDEDEMTVNMYRYANGQSELYDTYTLKSECSKNNHKEIYDVDKNEISCNVCGEVDKEFTGDIKDSKGNEYYFLAGKVQTGWVTIGEEVRYYAANGIREKVDVRVEKGDCIVDTEKFYTSESGETKKIRFNDAGGHEYEEVNGKFICSVCDWQRVKMEDCNIKMQYDKLTYTGKPRIQLLEVYHPVTGKKLERLGRYRDYNQKTVNNVEVGTAEVTLTAARYGYYVNINDWRGSYEGRTTLKFDIVPDSPKNAKTYYKDGKDILTWEASKAPEVRYEIYQSVNGSTYKKIGTTAKTSVTLKDISSTDKYSYKVYAYKEIDGKIFKSMSYAFAKMFSVTASSVANSKGKPVVKWNKVDGAKYTVYVATSKTGTYKKLGTSTTGQLTHTSALTGKYYYYKVKAVANGKTVNSKITSERCILATPVVSKTTYKGKPRLTWKTVKDADRYEVYRATSKTGTYTKMFTTTKTSYTNTSAKVGRTYYYKVKAIFADNQKANSKTNTVSQICKLATPVTKIALTSKGKPKVTWNKVNGAVKYEVYRATSKTGSYTKMFTTTKPSYINTTAKAGKTYYYKVKAIHKNTKANSVFSLVKSIKAK